MERASNSTDETQREAWATDTSHPSVRAEGPAPFAQRDEPYVKACAGTTDEWAVSVFAGNAEIKLTAIQAYAISDAWEGGETGGVYPQLKDQDRHVQQLRKVAERRLEALSAGYRSTRVVCEECGRTATKIEPTPCASCGATAWDPVDDEEGV